METIENIKIFFASLQINITKAYLILANIVLVIFAIWFANVGLLPFKNFGDFAFFAILALILGLYRPGWTFAFFVGTLALENINLAPKGLGLSLRPYQLFGFITMVALLVQMISKRLVFSLPKFHWYDGLPIIFAISGFLSALGVASKGASLKQSAIALSFVALYFLVRIYVQSFDDLKRIVPFFLSSGFVVATYAIWQNIRFLGGANSFEVMPGRPNGTFTEPDWLGIYLTFLISAVFVMIYYFNKNSASKKSVIFNFQFSIFNKFSITQFLNYLFLTLILTTLILTVSRSAWVGAAIVIIGFLKFVLTNGTLRASKWQWKKFTAQGVFVLVALAISLSIAIGIPLTRFQLFSRAASTGGLQKITIACEKSHSAIPEKIENISSLAQYGCRHINLEDIEKEKDAGNEILEILRPDPNVNIRAEIYQKSIAQIKAHPIFGIGWGSIAQILGTDERGAGLNASNIFLEVWLGSGLLGILSFVILLFYIFISAIIQYLNSKISNKITSAFVLLGWVAIVVPNLFNSGIFLGFVWAYLGISISLLAENKKVSSIVK